MKDFIDWRRQEDRRERIRNRPPDWRMPTPAEWAEGIGKALKSAQQIMVDFHRSPASKTWDYKSLFRR